MLTNLKKYFQKNKQELQREWLFWQTEDKQIKWLSVAIFIFPILLFLFANVSLPYLGADLLYNFLAKEDGLFEYSQALMVLSTAIITILIARQYTALKKEKVVVTFFYLLAFLFLFVGIEEISWGQRLLDIELNELWKEYNVQEETTIHNLEPFQPILNYIVLFGGLFVSFSYLLKPKFRQSKKTILQTLANYLPGPKFFATGFIVFILAFLYIFIRLQNIHWWTYNFTTKELETAETLMYWTLLLVFLTNWLNLRKILKND